MSQGLIIYLIIANMAGILVMGLDKNRAKNHEWRISETVLFAVSLIGGSLGTWAGMYIFHHKTKHWYFVIGMPVIFTMHILIALKMMGVV